MEVTSRIRWVRISKGRLYCCNRGHHREGAPMGERIPAEVFPPGEVIREELEARGWSQVELSDIMGRPPRVVSEVMSGKRAITPETAKGLGAAFGTGASFWVNLEGAYQLSKTVHDDAT